MADRRRAVAENVPGDFFVDETCIDCDACRQLAPEVFRDANDHSFVHAQPVTAAAERNALRALLACPTGSIGTLHPGKTRAVRADFPLPIEDGISYCGFNSPKSFGGNSYLIERAAGNWLVASARDDGKGFDVGAVQAGYATRGSLGMINIQERAELAQGEATIDSARGRGTTVSVRVPLSS